MFFFLENDMVHLFFYSFFGIDLVLKFKTVADGVKGACG